MKRLLLLLILLPSLANATAYTASVTGDWDNAATFGGAGVPGNGDTVTINNGITVTVPVGYTAIVGSSPDNDSGTIALQCATDNGTGILNIEGTLKWRGPVRQCNGTWTVAAGGTLTYDSSLASGPSTAYYKWVIGMNSNQANAKLVFAGTSGSHVTVNSEGNNPSGNFGIGAVNWSDGGRIESTYADISYQGAATQDFLTARPNTSAASVFFDNSTLDHCGQINLAALGAPATFRVKNTVIRNPANTSFTIQAVGTTAKTSGQRLIQNSSIAGRVYVLATGGVDTGFEVKNLVSRPAAFSSQGGTQFTSGGTLTSWDSVLFAFVGNAAVDLVTYVPAGSLTNSYMYRQGDPSMANMHPVYVSTVGANTLFDSWIWDYTGTDINSDMIELTGADAGSARTLTVTHNIFLPNADGTAVGTFVNNSSTQPQTNTKITFDHNTGVVSGAVAANVVHGVGCEAAGTTWPAGAVQSARNNIVWRLTAGTGPLFNSTSNCTISDGAVVVADYNNAHNLTETIYGMAGAKYAATPGTNDFAVDPQFLAPTRNMLSFDQGYLLESVGTAWQTSTSYSAGDIVSSSTASFYGGATYNYRCTTAHTSGATDKPGSGSAWTAKWESASIKYIEDSVVAGETFGSNSMITELIDWVKTGFTPANAALDGTGHDGSDIGAVVFSSSVNGACGTNSGQSFDTLESGTANNCATGTVASFAGSGPWTWGCNGSGGGTSTAADACTASLNSYTVTPSVGAGGTLTPATPQSVDYGSTQVFTVAANTCFTVDSVSGCGGVLDGATFTTAAITGNCTVTAAFAAAADKTVTPSAGTNGTISPDSPQVIACGATQAFTVTPSAGFRALVGGTCGGSLVGATYTTNAVNDDCTVAATFAVIPSGNKPFGLNFGFGF